ncbi:MAG: hypothetical protein GF355_09060, partial [Candidatus Eisenbacteria bacterium]|nr:hypothetical protein [Candidatus Eisenbacteria bacterium]
MRPTITLSATLSALLIALLSLLAAPPSGAEEIQTGMAGTAGMVLSHQDASGVDLRLAVDRFGLEAVALEDETAQKVTLPGVFLPNDAGAPDLPGLSRMIALPEGATVTYEIVRAETQVYADLSIAPAPVIPREDDDSPLVYEKNPAIFERDAHYPAGPVMVSEVLQMRGVDAVMVGITPFQYNPVTRELLVYTELEVRLDFQGNTGVFGEQRLRSRYWEPILQNNLLNYASLPPLAFGGPEENRDGAEYIIITPDHPDFIAWGDTLKAWRTKQGIITECYTTAETGTSWTSIESFLNNAYNTWDPAPVAFLLLGDYPNSGDGRDSGITSPTWSGYCVSDNMYADVDGDDLPDMAHGRICARDNAELERMINKMLDYERAPYTDAGFYDHPVIAGGWQTERWFILCTEICLGYLANVLGKDPVREYAIYSGSPGSTWSTNPNTYMLLDYFGPSGLGYIPSTPAHLTDWGANATRLNNDLNAGAFILLHRDHGGVTGWGEPDYDIGDLSGLNNEMYPYVFSINCLTGKYDSSSQCFTEAFHRMEYGALGLMAASDVSYSFVNDTYIFGMMDSLWPDFMPGYPYMGPDPGIFNTDLLPGFANANGKYFLDQSNWPYNQSNKDETNNLFHHHGDTFMQIYSEVPQALTVSHDPTCLIGAPTFNVQADAGALIGLVLDGEIIGRAIATGASQDITIDPPIDTGTLHITVTKTNYFRYSETVPVLPPEGPYLTYNSNVVHDESGDNDGVPDAGETIGLDILLENVGVEPATNISGVLSTTDPFVTITTAENDYPDIPAGGVANSLAPFEAEIAGTIPDQHQISFTITAHADEGDWDDTFTLTAEAPLLVSAGTEVSDPPPGGNADGGADPGETFNLRLTLQNNGHSPTSELNG